MRLYQFSYLILTFTYALVLGCEVGKWSKWSQCSTTCGKGIQIRRRSTREVNGTDECPKGYTQRSCIVPQSQCVCRDIHSKCDELCGSKRKDKAYMDWLDQYCSKTCGPCGKLEKKKQKATSKPKQPNQDKIKTTKEEEEIEKEKKKEEEEETDSYYDSYSENSDEKEIEPQKCECEKWSSWSKCSEPCGGCGRKTRTRKCTPNNMKCFRTEKRICNQVVCEKNDDSRMRNGCCAGLFADFEGLCSPMSGKR